jgi:sigma-54 dependent transcriptional regulator
MAKARSNAGHVLTLASLTNEVSRPTIRATALVFEDAASRDLETRLNRVAPSIANVLIVGETGTGKELAARFIHDASARRSSPFVAVNCGAFVESLIEAELFGHERGAFTGAIDARAGWFEVANGGSIFLDEVGDLPLSLQVKLLRVLQEREVVRVGSRKPMPVDVRVIAATNVDLEEAVRLGRFRQDLFYRLNVARIDLKPLRERTGDILPLARFFLDLYGRQHERAGLQLANDTIRILLSYHWPGNIREIENVMHHAVLVTHGAEIRPGDLNLSRLGPEPGATNEPQQKSLEAAFGRLFDDGAPAVYDDVTSRLVHSALERCGGNQVQTARLLGISRNVLRSHLARMGVIAGRRRTAGPLGERPDHA